MHTARCANVVEFIKSLYPAENPVPLHAPRFQGNEKKYLAECIDTTFVSYVGKFVTDFEDHVRKLTGASHAIAMVNGTAALQMALVSAGVKPGDEIVTQALTFVGTPAAIKHAGAEPAFIDVDSETMGMSPDSLRKYFAENAELRHGETWNKRTDRRIFAAVPMHTFGHPARIDEIADVCREYGVALIEDSAESVGSYYKGKHTGTFGVAGILSFNGNKPITTGGGGMLITDDERLADRARYLSTTAKRKHRWEFYHEEVGYNLRLPNVNAAIGCAQMEYFSETLKNKRETARLYGDFFGSSGISFFREPADCLSNYWLNAIVLDCREEREEFLLYSNDNGVQTRPIWTLMNKLPPYSGCFHGDLRQSEWFEDRVVNIPSSVRL